MASIKAGNPGAQLEVHNEGEIIIVDTDRRPLFTKP